MSAAYSTDLRSKAVEKYESGNYKQVEVCEFFGISVSSFKRWLKMRRETGNLEPIKGDKGRPPKIDADGFITIKKAINKNNAITLEDLSALYYAQHKVKVGRSILSRALKKLKLNRKKLSVRSAQKDTPETKKKS
jgi:transposase